MGQYSKNLKENKNKINLIVFDVDGVLIDTQLSFPLAISQAIYHYGNLIFSFDWEKPSFEEINAFKAVPGFNNDWDLAQGLLIYYLQKERLPRPLDFDQFLVETTGLGNGLQGIENWSEQLNPDYKAQIYNIYHPKLIRQLGKEYYAGEEYCQYLYGFIPQFGIRKGTIEKEQTLINKELLSELPHFKGIYTGRNVQELNLIQDKIGREYYHDACVVCDDGIHPLKPDPEPIKEMMMRCKSQAAVFVGDSKDDQKTTDYFDLRYKIMNLEFVQVLGDKQPFDGKHSYVNNVNQLLEFFL